MEGREPPAGLSPSALHSMAAQAQGPSFSAILQRGPLQHSSQHSQQSPQHQQQQQQQSSQQQQQQSTTTHHHPGIHMPSPPGLHAPSAMRPSSAASIGSPNPSAGGASGGSGFPGDGSMALVSQQLSGSMGMAVGMIRPGEPVKRKRGRPRKYGDGASASSNVSLALTPLSSMNPISSPPTEKRRGRPPGSGKKQQLAALGSAGQQFTPHVITIAAGEDVATKIMSFSQTGPRAVCVLSANGAISNVTLRQPASSGGTVTYEGRFEILSLSGSFLLTESGGTRSRTGGLSVSLAGPDGRVVGGGVAGLLMAASPVQVVVGSFIADTRKAVLPRPLDSMPSPQAVASGSGGMQRPTKNESGVGGGPRSPDSSPSHMEQQGSGSGGGGGGGGGGSGSGGGGGSNLMHSHSQVQGMGSLQSMGWSGSQSLSEPRRDTDINIPLPNG